MHYETYTIKGRKYKYSVHNYRTGEKVRHKKTYVGPVEPVNKAQRKKGQGRKPEIFVRELTKDEKRAIEKSVKSCRAFVRDRAKILLLSSKGTSAKDIAKMSSSEIRKVRAAIKSFNNRGISALQRGKAKGAARKFDDIKKKIILMHFSKSPKDFGLHFTAWTLPRFRDHLIDYNVVESISIESLRQILMKSGAKLEKSKRWQYSPDKDFHKKNLQ
jgi:transposase